METKCIHCDRLRDYMIALEHTRADLWGVNEDLRLKIAALEKGQEDLIEENNRVLNTLTNKSK